MTRSPFALIRDDSGASAAEMVLVLPLLIILMFGPFEVGNLLLTEHALTKQVRDGARFAARMEINSAYSCGSVSSVFADSNAADEIINVTKTGAVSGSGNPRWVGYWGRNCSGEAQTVTVSVRCVDKSEIDTEDTGKTGVYTALDGQIPVVKVSGAVEYLSLFDALGYTGANVCLRAESESPVAGV